MQAMAAQGEIQQAKINAYDTSYQSKVRELFWIFVGKIE